jgi:hypothetical protein
MSEIPAGSPERGVDDDLSPRKMNIVGRQKRIEGHFWSRTTVQRAKQAVSNALQIDDPDDVVLLYKSQELDPEASLADLGLSDNAVVSAEEKPRVLLVRFTKNGKRKRATTRYLSSATVQSARIRLAPQLGGVRLSDFVLTYNGNDLDDDVRIRSLNIPDDDYVEVKIRPPSVPAVFKLWTGEVADIRFDETATIAAVRAKLSEELGIDPALLCIDAVYETEEDLLKDSVPESGIITVTRSVDLTETIGSETFLELEGSEELEESGKPHHLTIKMSGGSSVRAKFREAATIGKMKQKLGAAFQVSPDRIIVRGVDDDNTLILSVLRGETSSLSVDIPVDTTHKPLKLVLDDGTVANGRYRSGATVRKVKHALAKKLSLDPENLFLSYGYTELDDNVLISSLDLVDTTLFVQVAR